MATYNNTVINCLSDLPEAFDVLNECQAMTTSGIVMANKPDKIATIKGYVNTHVDDVHSGYPQASRDKLKRRLNRVFDANIDYIASTKPVS